MLGDVAADAIVVAVVHEAGNGKREREEALFGLAWRRRQQHHAHRKKEKRDEGVRGKERGKEGGKEEGRKKCVTMSSRSRSSRENNICGQAKRAPILFMCTHSQC